MSQAHIALQRSQIQPEICSINPRPKKNEDGTNDSPVASDPARVLLPPVANSGLCERCLAIDFDEIFNREIPDNESFFVMNLGSLQDMKASHCQMCQLFVSVAPCDLSPKLHLRESAQSLLKTGSYHLRIFSGSEAFTGFGYRCRTREAKAKGLRETNVLGVTPSNSTNEKCLFSNVFDMFSVLEETGYLSLESSITSRSICKFRTLDFQVFDFGLAKTWMSYCDENHQTQCCRKTIWDPRNFRVFDCRTRKAVDAPVECRYVALSYVWGASASDGSSHNGGGSLEKVVEDSIVVAQNLGFQFIWVDRLCIDQKDAGEKLYQISKMDLIYANSALTIIAAAGNGADYGLPGVNMTLRAQQPRLKFQDKCFVSTLPSGRHTLKKSKWQTRGWTFQEGMLSTKRLIFTEAQVLFECNGMHCSEVLSVPLDLMHLQETTSFDNLAYRLSALSAKTPNLSPKDYMKYVHSYSLRDLTYREDALKAFGGILNAFRNAQRPVHNFWGIPIFLTNDFVSIAPNITSKHNILQSNSERFALALFWKAPEGTSRRLVRTKTGFPSWTWAGWHGAVADKFPLANFGKGCYRNVRVWFEDSFNTITSLDNVEFGRPMPSLQECYSNIIQIEGYTIDIEGADLQFSPREEAYSESVPEDGIYVGFRTSSGRKVYSKLESYDLSWYFSSGNPLMGFLPSAPSEIEGGMNQRAMLLEKVGRHYERVGLFKHRYYWHWDENGILQRLGARKDRIGCEPLQGGIRRFWLG